MRCWCSSRLASSWLTPSRTVMSRSLVISSATFCRGSVAKRTSRLVRMPTSLPACAVAAALHHRNAGDVVLLHQRERVGERRVRMDGERVHHHAGFELLDLAHLGGLLVRLEIAVDDADAAGLRHGDRHLGLGHRVHGRGDDRQVERDRAGDAGADIDLRRQHVGQAGLEQHVVEGERLGQRGIARLRPSPTPARPDCRGSCGPR